MSSEPRAALHISPHPDDEVLGAPATLMSLRDAGWRVVNLACGLGRQADAERRAGELAEACRRAGFELVVSSQPVAIGKDDDLTLARTVMVEEIRRAIDRFRPQVIIGPSADDAHHGHQVVGHAIGQAVESLGASVPTASEPGSVDRGPEPVHVMRWGLWRDLPSANVMVPFGASRLAEIWDALAAHEGELARNRFERLLEGRALANAVLGPERLFGYGSPGISEEYAELLLDLAWSPSGGWLPTRPRIFDPHNPFG